MTEFESNNGVMGYDPIIPYFRKLYVDHSYGSPTTKSNLSEACWDVVNDYVSLFSGQYGLSGSTLEPDPLEELVSHRSAVLKAQMEGLAAQLYERRKIHEGNLNRINYDVVKTDTELMKIDDLTHGFRLNVDKELSKKEQSLEQDLLNLERQRRDEDVSFWKDQVLLKKELIELAGPYTAARAREKILGEVNMYGA